MISKIVGKPKVIGFVGDVNTGKSNTLYYILDELNRNYKYKLYYYGLRLDVEGQRVYSIRELEEIEDSFIIIDELSSLFDLDNRKNKKIIEQVFRLLNHNNNIIILCGTPENFKKFISGKLNMTIYKKCTIEDFINMSEIKNVLTNYKGYELGSTLLNLPINEALFYDGKHYHKINIPYMKEFDSKAENAEIFKPRAGDNKGLNKNKESIKHGKP